MCSVLEKYPAAETYQTYSQKVRGDQMHQNTPEYFYTLRSLDRDKEAYQTMSKIERASRLIYLNKTCFNGLFRVNLSGEFNSPFGYYKNPNIVNEPVLRAVNKYFSSSRITFCNEDFAETLSKVNKAVLSILTRRTIPFLRKTRGN